MVPPVWMKILPSHVVYDKHVVGASSRLAQPPLAAFVLSSVMIKKQDVSLKSKFCYQIWKNNRSALECYWVNIKDIELVLLIRISQLRLFHGQILVHYQFVQCFWDELLPQRVLIILKSRPHDTRSIPTAAATTTLKHLPETHYTSTTLITTTTLCASVSSSCVPPLWVDRFRVRAINSPPQS